MKDLRIVIVGAGIGGLSAGIALRNAGFDVEIHDQVQQMRPVGAAISLWSNGVKCLNRLGLGAEIAQLGGIMDGMAYLDGPSGTMLTEFSLQPLIDAVGQRPYPVARADLQQMLLAQFGPEKVRLGSRLMQVKDDGTAVTAVFEDGREVRADMLLGADGTHSIVRRHVLGRTVERRYAGYVNWNGLVPVSPELAPADRWTTWVGEHKRVSLMPVSGNRFYFFFDVPLPHGTRSDREQLRAELSGHFEGWAAPMQKLIASLDPMTTNRVEIHDIEPFDDYALGRVALLGDAAHSTTPDLGQGGCQAMEDAIALATALQCHTLSVEDCLQRYSARRSPRAGDLVLKARKRCDITHGKDPAATQQWYDELRGESGEAVIAGIVRNIQGSPLG